MIQAWQTEGTWLTDVEDLPNLLRAALPTQQEALLPVSYLLYFLRVWNKITFMCRWGESVTNPAPTERFWESWITAFISEVFNSLRCRFKLHHMHLKFKVCFFNLCIRRVTVDNIIAPVQRLTPKTAAIKLHQSSAWNLQENQKVTTPKNTDTEKKAPAHCQKLVSN